MVTLWWQVRIHHNGRLSFIKCHDAGGQADLDKHGKAGQKLNEVLDYDPKADKWTKVGQMATAREDHAMSLVPGDTSDFRVW